MTRERILKILVVDADERVRREVRGHLEHHGYHVECAGNAVDAIRLGLTLRPHVLIADQHLAEDTSGVTVAEALKRHVEAIECILMTSDPVEELRDEAADVDGAEILGKPIGIGALGELVERLLERARAARGE